MLHLLDPVVPQHLVCFAEVLWTEKKHVSISWAFVNQKMSILFSLWKMHFCSAADKLFECKGLSPTHL